MIVIFPYLRMLACLTDQSDKKTSGQAVCHEVLGDARQVSGLWEADI